MLGVASVNKSEILRNGIVEDYKSDRGQNIFPFLFAVLRSEKRGLSSIAVAARAF